MVGACVSQLQESERALKFKNWNFRNLLLKRLLCLKGVHWWKGTELQISEWGLNITGGQKYPCPWASSVPMFREMGLTQWARENVKLELSSILISARPGKCGPFWVHTRDWSTASTFLWEKQIGWPLDRLNVLLVGVQIPQKGINLHSLQEEEVRERAAKTLP